MPYPTVSIITPLFNTELYFEDTIKSVLNQTFKDWEWIIVDDCSTDRSLDLLKKYNDPRIIVIKNEKNLGTSASRNKALEVVKGKYVTFLDSDDYLDNNYLENQVKFIKDNGPIIVSGYRRKTDKSVSNFVPPKVTTSKSILKGNPMACLTSMYEFEKFKTHRFDDSLKWHEDFLFWIKILSEGYSANGNPEILATYRIVTTGRNYNRMKLLKPIYHVYREGLGFSFCKSAYYVISMVLYSMHKYKDVK